MRPKPTRFSIHIDPARPRLDKFCRRALLVCTAALASLPAAAQDYTLNTDSLNLTSTTSLTLDSSTLSNSITTLDTSSFTIVSSTLTLTDSITVLDPSLTLDAPTLQIDDSISRLSTTNFTLDSGVTVNSGSLQSAGSAGLARLVAPGNEGANIVVGRLGAAPQAGSANLTIDFDGDGLINFEIAPGIVEVQSDAADRGGDALAGLVGQPISMATGTADRVLDSVINVVGVTPATTFEITDGTVVLGGPRIPEVAGLVDNLPVPDGSPSHDPRGKDGRDPDGRTSPNGNDHATHDPVVDDARSPDEFCVSHGCYPIPPRPGSDDGPEMESPFSFTGFREPPRPETSQGVERDDLLNVSIMLPLRGREEQGDQFSNYGNEEIW